MASSRPLGQNFLIDSRVTGRIVDLLGHPHRVVELGAGNGAVTARLPTISPVVTAVEVDPRWVARLRRDYPQVRVVRCDMLRFRFPRGNHVVVGNLPYAVTTAMTRRLLAHSSWSTAVLLVQWDVAHKRAAGGSMLNAQWAPWYEFELHGRVPATAFRPVPSVDGGLLRIQRHRRPLLAERYREDYQQFVRAVFTGRGSGLPGILRNLSREHAWPVFPAGLLPRDLAAHDWVELYTGLRRSELVPHGGGFQRNRVRAARPQPDGEQAGSAEA